MHKSSNFQDMGEPNKDMGTWFQNTSGFPKVTKLLVCFWKLETAATYILRVKGVGCEPSLTHKMSTKALDKKPWGTSGETCGHSEWLNLEIWNPQMQRVHCTLTEFKCCKNAVKSFSHSQHSVLQYYSWRCSKTEYKRFLFGGIITIVY